MAVSIHKWVAICAQNFVDRPFLAAIAMSFYESTWLEKCENDEKSQFSVFNTVIKIC